MNKAMKCIAMLGVDGLTKLAQASTVIEPNYQSPENRITFDQRAIEDPVLSSNGIARERLPSVPLVRNPDGSLQRAPSKDYIYAHYPIDPKGKKHKINEPRARCYVRDKSGNLVKFDMLWYRGKDVPKPIWLGETKITQELFEAVMDYNPSHYNGKRKELGREIDWGFKPSRPVENVSWSEIIHFCNRLSAMHGFTPYYKVLSTRIDDLRQRLKKEENTVRDMKVIFQDKPYQGLVPDIEKTIDDLIKRPIDARIITKLGFDSASNGYRLEAEDEWKSVCRAAGFLDKTAKETERHGYWQQTNILNADLIPVAQMLPDELGFYDIVGSVAEVFHFKNEQLAPDYRPDTLSYSQQLLKAFKAVHPSFDKHRFIYDKSGKIYDAKVGSTIEYATSERYVQHPSFGFRLARNAFTANDYKEPDIEELKLPGWPSDDADDDNDISYDDSSDGYKEPDIEELKLPGWPADDADNDDDDISYDDSSGD